MKPKIKQDQISQITNDPKRMQLIIQTAINEAMLKHKQAGNPVCGFKNGELYWVNAENILIKKG